MNEREPSHVRATKLVANEPHVYKIAKKKHREEIEKHRTVLSIHDDFPDPQNIFKYTAGIIGYIIVFIVFIPYLMIRNGVSTEILLAYMPNVDMIATALGYKGGPFADIWRYLYNPSNFTLFGFFSTTLMNYFALLGGTFLVAWTTHKHKSWKYGWSSAFIFLFLTYLAPGNLIVISQQWIGDNLVKTYPKITHLEEYSAIVVVGLGIVAMIIMIEVVMIRMLRSHIVNAIDTAHNHFK